MNRYVLLGRSGQDRLHAVDNVVRHERFSVVLANMAIGPAATAKQNIASNKGNVKIGGNNNQEVTVKNGAIANMAIGPMAKAEQNVASNDGK